MQKTNDGGSGELKTSLEQRADYITFDEVVSETAVDGAVFVNAVAELKNKSLRLLVGPRGCGKTHMMRYTWANCRETHTAPFAIYVSFNRYYRLEPLQTSRPNPIELFHSWALALIVLATLESLIHWTPGLERAEKIFEENGFVKLDLISLVSRLERGQPLSDVETKLSGSLSIFSVLMLIEAMRIGTGRKYAVLFLDDAALTLTPDYLVEFLDIVRALKTSTIAPKASVYPGTTEYSPRFHQGQDALAVQVWQSIEAENYSEVMGAIAECRIVDFKSIPEEVSEIFKFAAFGIPRAYLAMLWEFKRGGFKTSQQAVNQVIQAHLESLLSQYRSLEKKVPKFATIIRSGESLLMSAALMIQAGNVAAMKVQQKQLTIGIPFDDVTSLVKRMLDLLMEAGLVFPQKKISHGSPERIYLRYMPHTAALLNVRAFSGGDRGGLKQIVEALQLKTTKHPVRRQLSKFLTREQLDNLAFDLPECGVCRARRLSAEQRFCHACGSQLLEASTFTQCLGVSIESVPGLTLWQKQRIAESLPKFKTIGDYLAKQDPSAELLTVYGVGKKKAAKIVDVLNAFVDEFLS